MTKLFVTAFFTWYFFTADLFAQPDPSLTWREIAGMADEFYKANQYEEAAEMYLFAYDGRNNRMNFIEKAAEAYASNRQYAKAIPLFLDLMENERRFPMAGLRYAQMLKQDEQYEKAMEAFRAFRLNYDTRARNSAEVFDLVQREIRGINTYMDNSKRSELPDATILSKEINSEATEIAPFFHGDWLYFTSTQIGNYAIFRSQPAADDWMKPLRPAMFRQIGDRHFAGGSFSADGRFFYFSICDEKPGVDPLSCKIYAMEERDGLWANPVALPEIINTPGHIQAHPQLVRFIDRDYLLFSSNRPGGQGGMDIWYSWKSSNADISAFTLPVNAGTPVNTPGHEVTPFFDTREQALYFSSNYHAGFGGYDVFSARGEPRTWRNVQNLGLPVNSGADDWYYNTLGGPYQVLWSSNRKSGELNQTQHDNIYGIRPPQSQPKLSISGHVHHLARPSQHINRVNLSLYALDLSGQRVLIQNQATEDGSYLFNLRPGRQYQLTAVAYGYFSQTLEFSTEGVKGDAHVRQLIELEPEPGFSLEIPMDTAIVSEATESAIGVVTDEEPEVIAIDTTTLVEEEPVVETDLIEEIEQLVIADEVEEIDAEEDIAEETESIQHEEPSDSIQVKEETTSPDTAVIPALKEEIEAPATPAYKIQLAAVVSYNAAEFSAVGDIGKLKQETAPNGLIRVLVGSFENEEAARNAKQLLIQAGFDGSFIVRYINGERSLIGG